MPKASLGPSFVTVLSLATSMVMGAGAVVASDTPDPSSVTVAGSLQSELGCPGDWAPECAVTHLTFNTEDLVWQAAFNVPAGGWEYKAALSGSWDENYGQNAQRGGANIPLGLDAARSVKFYYDHETHWITDNATTIIAVAPGSFQSELGCASDWDPSCLRSWLQDPEGDGTFTLRTRGLPAGDYEAKVAIDESWTENYGEGGVPGGPNIPFSVASDCAEMLFSYDGTTHILTIEPAPPAEQPASVTIAGSLQSELGCSGDWDPACAATHLTFNAEDVVWQRAFDLPAGSFEYKAALNDSWAENYGQNATRDGPNIPLNLTAAGAVKFYYEHGTHWVADNETKTIAVAPGSFQSELGCASDWDPSCLRSWLQDPDGDGFFHAEARLPAGDYETKVAIDESWAENYGQDGIPNGPNIPFTVPQSCVPVFFNYDGSTHVLTVGARGGPRGNLKQSKAYWLTADTFAWNPASLPEGALVHLHHSATAGLGLDATGVTGGESLALVHDPAGLSAALKAKFPHLASYAAFKIATPDVAAIKAILKGQTAMSVKAADGTPIDATSVQIPGVLDDLYHYDGSLGVTFRRGVPTLRAWAPTAQSVTLQVFADSNPATVPTEAPMTLDPATGVWSVTGSRAWNRAFYLYKVVVFAPSTLRIETNLVTDPYSVSLSANSKRSQVVNLNDSDLQPNDWDELSKPQLDGPEDITLYELHVRDFSIGDLTVDPPWRGTFRAFAAARSNGMKHLRRLAQAGLTHVHLLPSFDFATVPERREDQLQPSGDLASMPPDSDQQQAAVMAVANQDGFNWGYDPFHYTVPEGSYATNPDGPQRIVEFRQMVKGLADAKLRVIMDVVYNHTTASGQNERSVLDRIVPGYYHRQNASGGVENSTCCANTASEHAMMEKLMVDSVVTWAKAYKVDGFRFDLMGHHMKSNMLKVRDALRALRPWRDGVDGRSIYIYGEGWNFGEVADGARGENAIQRNMAGTGIGSFDDRSRDAIRGGGPFSGLQEQGFINGLFYDPNGTPQGDERQTLLHRSDWLRLGLAGNLASFTFEDRFGNTVTGAQLDYLGQPAGYTRDPIEDIKYADAHDNEPLFDALQLKVPVSASIADRVRMQNLGISLVGLGQGIPFFHAGVEMLRSKSMDRDSFNSGDWFNKLDFTYTSNNWGVGLPPAEKNETNWPIMRPRLANPALKPGTADIRRALDHMSEILEIRKSSKLFRLPTGAAVNERLTLLNTGPNQIPGVVGIILSDPSGQLDARRKRIVVVFNATDEAQSLVVPDLAGKALSLHSVQARSSDPVVRGATFTSSSASFLVPARTTAVFEERRRGH